MRATRTPDVTSQHPTNNLPTFLCHDAKWTDAPWCPLSPQHLADSLNFNHVQDIAHTLLAPRLDTSTNNNSGSIASCVTDIHPSFDRNHNKTVSTGPDVTSPPALHLKTRRRFLPHHMP